MPTEQQIDSVVDAYLRVLAEFELEYRRGAHASNWHAIRIYPDGEVRIVEDASMSIPNSEYFRESPHPLTLRAKQSDGYIPSVEDNLFEWKPDDDGPYISSPDGRRYEVVERVLDKGGEELLEDYLSKGWYRFSLDLDSPLEYLDISDLYPDDDIEEIRDWAVDNLID